MAFFPFFADIRGAAVLLVGGGEVALRRAEALLPFGPALTVAAPRVLPALAALPGVTVREVPFAPSLLVGAELVLAATDSRETNKMVATLCHQKQIPVNVADDPPSCSFLFPALICRGDLSVGICTQGQSPAAAAWLREQVEALLPERMEEILDLLGSLRPVIREKVPEAEKRAALFRSLLAACLQAGRPLTEEELTAWGREAAP